MLAVALEALAAQNFDLKLSGFDLLELAEAMAQESPRGSLDLDAVPELANQRVSRTGDLWTLGKHQILCRDGTRAR